MILQPHYDHQLPELPLLLPQQRGLHVDHHGDLRAAQPRVQQVHGAERPHLLHRLSPDIRAHQEVQTGQDLWLSGKCQIT